MQLGLFDTEVKEQDKYPWLRFFPDWMPEVRGMAQMGVVILEGQGYCHMDKVRVISIDGDDVVCTVEFELERMYWKCGKVYRCKIWELWPITYNPIS